jgi:type IV pilus assembly protein PilB
MPLHVLRRAVALPYRLEGETLHVALADPQNVHAIDELRLATRYQLSLGVAARDDILAELDRMDRVSER